MNASANYSSSEDDEPAHSADQGKPVGKSGPSLLRIVLFALLGVAIIGLIIDRQARSSSKEAFDKLDRALGPERNLQKVTREQVHALAGRAPDADEDPNDNYETFTWRGAFRPYTVYVVYFSSTEPQLKDVSIDDPPPRANSLRPANLPPALQEREEAAKDNEPEDAAK